MKTIPSDPHITYTYQWRNCGACSKCKGNNQKNHGPYIYSAWRENKRVRTRYVRPVAVEKPPRTCKCGAIESEVPFKPGSRQCRKCAREYQKAWRAQQKQERLQWNVQVSDE